jgi:hypothetical protein
VARIKIEGYLLEAVIGEPIERRLPRKRKKAAKKVIVAAIEKLVNSAQEAVKCPQN